jgi:hypothetical protein
MLRLAIFVAFLALAELTQAQTFSRGAPASVVSPEPDGRQHGVPAGATSPEPDGRLHGVPASIFSPVPRPPFGVAPFPSPFIATGHGPRHRFGTGKGHHNNLVFVPVPLFYPIYPDAAYPVADPNVQAPAESAEQAAGNADPAPATNGSSGSGDDALRAAYLQGARDAMTQQQQSDPRYGGHYMDSRERVAGQTSVSRAARKRDSDENAAPAAPPKEDDSPATVFIFKDGSQIETRNFAIMGQTLYDFSSKQLKKIELADLDKTATTKANDDRGIQVKLP